MDVVSVLVRDRGSVFESELPDAVKSAFVTVWECSNKGCIMQSSERSVYVDQSQSLNLYLKNPSSQSVTSMLFYGWSVGLKTGMYYLRTRAKAAAVQFVGGVSTDGVSTDGVSTDGVSTDGVSTDGVSTDGVSTDGECISCGS